MLNTIAFILQHPLVIFAFLFWGVAPDWEKGHDFVRSAFFHFDGDFGHGQSTSVSFANMNDGFQPTKLILSAISSRSRKERTTTTEPPLLETTTTDLTFTPAPNDYRPAPPSTSMPDASAPAAERPLFPRFKLANTLAEKYYRHHHHHHHHQYSDCRNVHDHLGKWSFGCAKMHLHYVCKSNRAVWCDTYGWARFGDSCYHAELDKAVSFTDAKLACERFRYESQLVDAHLVNITSQAENAFVQSLVSQQTVWIGLSTTNGTWTWQDGTALKAGSYANWESQSQPLANYTGRAINKAAFMNDWKVLCLPPPWVQSNINQAVLAIIIAIGATVVLTLLVSCVAKLIFLCTYKKSVTDKRAPLPEVAVHGQQLPDFHHSAFGCFEDMDVCIHSCCCSTIRAADTHKAAGTSEFWSVVLLWVFACVVGRILGGRALGHLFAGLLISGIMTHKRQMLKAKLGIAHGNCCADFLLWWCCTPCAIAQEARHVDAVTGVKVRCCCSLFHHPSPAAHPMVGSAVSMQPMPTAPHASYQQPAPTNYFIQTEPSARVITAQVVHIQPPGVAPTAFQMQPVV
jgi:Cys-rich protein (TIGR01571 family)